MSKRTPSRPSGSGRPWRSGEFTEVDRARPPDRPDLRPHLLPSPRASRPARPAIRPRARRPGAVAPSGRRRQASELAFQDGQELHIETIVSDSCSLCGLKKMSHSRAQMSTDQKRTLAESEARCRRNLQLLPRDELVRVHQRLRDGTPGRRGGLIRRRGDRIRGDELRRFRLPGEMRPLAVEMEESAAGSFRWRRLARVADPETALRAGLRSPSRTSRGSPPRAAASPCSQLDERLVVGERHQRLERRVGPRPPRTDAREARRRTS